MSPTLGDRGARTEDALGPEAPGADIALRELETIDAGRTEAELREAASREEADRTRRLKNVIGTLTRVGFVVSFLLAVGMAATYVAHLVLPPAWLWLDDDQTDKLTALFTGAIGTLLFNQIKKRLDE